VSEPLKILVVHGEVPMWDRNSLSVRLRNLLAVMAGDGHAVTLLARSAPPDQEPYARELEAVGIAVVRGDPVRAAEARWPVTGEVLDLETFLGGSGWDVAWLSEVRCTEQYAPLVRAYAPCARIVSDTGDVAWVREHRGAVLSQNRDALEAAQRTRAREEAAYRAADALVAVSAEDAAALGELAPGVSTAVISNIHEPVAPGPPFADRDGLVFVGSFGHAPNVDAMIHFRAEIWPLIRAAMSSVTLSIIGPWAPPAITALAGDGITVTGWVPDLRPHIDAARVAIAPLRFGAGVKGKVGEALAAGLPVVGTEIAFEGMDLEHGRHVLQADDPRAFADAVVRLHTDGRLWAALAEAGRSEIMARLGPVAARDALRALLSDLTGEIWVGDEEAIDGYLETFTPADNVALMLPVPVEAEAQSMTVSRITARITELGHDLEHIPDIALVPAGTSFPAPSRARVAPRAGATREEWTSARPHAVTGVLAR
jgi:glycosyltransferase involved in cell wall biosynthesis